jgi:hypothetical protein
VLGDGSGPVPRLPRPCPPPPWTGRDTVQLRRVLESPALPSARGRAVPVTLPWPGANNGSGVW